MGHFGPNTNALNKASDDLALRLLLENYLATDSKRVIISKIILGQWFFVWMRCFVMKHNEKTSLILLNNFLVMLEKHILYSLKWSIKNGIEKIRFIYIRASAPMDVKKISILQKKNVLFLFYTPTFTKYPYQFGHFSLIF